MRTGTYDANGWLATHVSPQDETTTFTYDGAGREVGKVLANGTRTSTTYDSAGRETQVLHLQSDNTTIAYFDYTYDLASRRTKVETHDDVVTWTYDATHQLLSEESTGVTEFHYTYTYDANGNRETKDDEGAVTTCTYNGANQLLTQETLSGTTTYTYDKAGNQETIEEPSGDITTRTWDCENYITQVEQPAGDLHTLTYNGDQQRVRKDDGTDEVIILWDGENILQETDDTNTVEVEYALEPAQHGNLISQHRDTETSYYHFDALGSTTALTDDTEVSTDKYTYEAFGKTRAETGATENAFRWIGRVGYYEDSELDNHCIRARTYSATQGRWLSTDPLDDQATDTNLYRYVHNSPLNRRDSSGLQDSRSLSGLADHTREQMNELEREARFQFQVFQRIIAEQKRLEPIHSAIQPNQGFLPAHYRNRIWRRQFKQRLPLETEDRLYERHTAFVNARWKTLGDRKKAVFRHWNTIVKKHAEWRKRLDDIQARQLQILQRDQQRARQRGIKPPPVPNVGHHLKYIHVYKPDSWFKSGEWMATFIYPTRGPAWAEQRDLAIAMAAKARNAETARQVGRIVANGVAQGFEGGLRLSLDVVDNIASAVEFANDPNWRTALGMLPVVSGSMVYAGRISKKVDSTPSANSRVDSPPHTPPPDDLPKHIDGEVPPATVLPPPENLPKRKMPPLSGPTRTGLPELPDGYHYRRVGEQTQVVRNPGRAGDLPPMHLDNGQLVAGLRPSIVRSTATRNAFLRSLADNASIPKSIKPWLRRGEIPPGYTVHHKKALFDGGTDTIDNMVLQGIDLHTNTHRFYRPGGQVPSINPRTDNLNPY